MTASLPTPMDDLPAKFRLAMRRLASTVCIVTCVNKDERHGMTATAVVSVCTDPPTLLVCINQNASIHEHLLASPRFCVNLLQHEQSAVAQAFAGTLKGEARFAVGQWDTYKADQDRTLLPLLRGAQANLVCTPVKSMIHGTHTIVLGHVETVGMSGEVGPLIYQNGVYARAVDIANDIAK
jgi:flavin reductase